jgi:hypothetical protein
MSIAQAQAEALAEGFLDNIGTTDKGDLRPKNTLTEAILLVGELIEDCQTNLNASNKVASGALSASLIANEPYQVGSVMQVDMLMAFYGKFVNKGVKGTRGGRSTANYSFRNEIVGRKMYAAIQEWIDRGKITTRTVKKYKGYGKHEKKMKSIAQLDMAYAVARSIKQKGLKPTGFLDKAVDKLRQKIASRLGNGLKIDIIESLSNI